MELTLPCYIQYPSGKEDRERLMQGRMPLEEIRRNTFYIPFYLTGMSHVAKLHLQYFPRTLREHECIILRCTDNGARYWVEIWDKVNAQEYFPSLGIPQWQNWLLVTLSDRELMQQHNTALVLGQKQNGDTVVVLNNHGAAEQRRTYRPSRRELRLVKE